MLVLEFRFPAGRYHATPWGRNVNEGVVEWPPSPYRLARALVDVCRRRRPDWSDERLEAVLHLLTTQPVFRLPPATASHIRTFLSSNTRDPTKKQKIFDAFVAVDKQELVLARFDCEAPEEVCRDLDDLLDELNYLGRSESWVCARVVESEPGMEFNCGPSGVLVSHDRTEPVNVACLKPEQEYGVLPISPISRKTKGRKGNKGKPLSWLEALQLSTSDLLKDGWSDPPSQKIVNFRRSMNALKPRPRRRKGPLVSTFRIARYALHSTVLPRVTDTVPFAERIRLKLMGIHRKVAGGDPAAVSRLFAGKDVKGKPSQGHHHAFILPLDEDEDGRIDHLLVKVSETFGASELDALDRLTSIWQTDGRTDVKLVLTSLSGDLPGESSTMWISATPFVIARHHRRGRGEYLEWLAGEVRRECAYHGLPEPTSIEWIGRTQSKGHQLRWMEFIRSRKGRRPLQGHGCMLTFPEPVNGPFAIGALCHFGLGLFLPRY